MKMTWNELLNWARQQTQWTENGALGPHNPDIADDEVVGVLLWENFISIIYAITEGKIEIEEAKKDIEWYEAYWQRLAESPTVANLVGYRKESEEKEMKNIEWLKEEIGGLPCVGTVFNRYGHGPSYIDSAVPVMAVYDLIDKVDKPEVLSQGWIDRNKEPFYCFENDKVGYYVSTDFLQNLIVPKKELPAIPKYMAEYIEWFKNDFEHNFAADIDLIINLIQVSHKFSRREKIKSWISKSGNPQKLIDAYRWGYEVEEEPLYMARLKVVTSEFTASYLRTGSPDAEDRLKALEIGCRPILENYRHLSEFTEHELKRLDIWDSDQWEVEEVEE